MDVKPKSNRAKKPLGGKPGDRDPARIPIVQNPTKFDAKAQELFLKLYAETGLKTRSARASGVCTETVNKLIASNKEFKQRVTEAHEEFKDSLKSEAFRRAVKGVSEPIIGGKDRDEVVCHVQRYSDRLLELALKAHCPEFTDKVDVDLNVRGGVLVIPAQNLSEKDWETQFGPKALGKPKSDKS